MAAIQVAVFLLSNHRGSHLMTTKLPADCLGQQNLAIQAYSTYCIGAGRAASMPAEAMFDDLFRPDFWVHHVTGAKTLRVGDIIRVRAPDGSFDCMLNVLAVPTGGAIMELWPKFATGTDAGAALAAADRAEAARPRVVPFLPNGKVSVRVEPVGKRWRVFAINQAELSPVHDTEGEALKAMDAYLEELRMVLPSPEEIAAKAAAAAKASEDRKYKARVEQASRAPKG